MNDKEKVELKDIDGYIEELKGMKDAVVRDLEKRTIMRQYTLCLRCETPLYPSPKKNEGIKWHEAKKIIEEHHQECQNPFPNCGKCGGIVYSEDETSRVGTSLICPNCSNKYQIGFEDR